MSSEQERIRRKLDTNPIAECNKVRQKFCPDLFQDFSGTKDPRHQSYTQYSNKELIGTVFYKKIAGIESMQAMTYEFTPENVTRNIQGFLGEKERAYLPHAVTINEYFERLDPEKLQRVQQKQVYELIRRKTFDDSRFQKKWLVIVDGTQTYSGSRKLNEGRLERHFHKDTEEEKINYRCDVLDAKIVFGGSLIVSVASEFIENNGEYERIPEKGRTGNAEYVNDIDYNGEPVNMLRFREERKEKGTMVRKEFQWLTSLRITEKNAEKIAGAGRNRWKIENEGFNWQKNWQGDITHACSRDRNAMKNHYLMTQISDMIKQLYFAIKGRQ